MEPSLPEQVFLRRVTAGTVRVVLLGAWIVWCLQIIFPFVVPILWGAIIATAVSPLTRWVFPKRPGLGAVIFGVLAFAMILVPSYLFLGSIGEFAVSIGKQWAEGQLKLPPPRAEVAEWPLIGKKLHALWTQAVNAPASVVEAHLPQIRDVGRWLMRSLAGLTLGVLQSLFAVVLAAAFLAKAEATHRALLPVADRIAPRRGQALMDLASATVLGVAKGVLGVAVIQAVLAWIGVAVAGVPAPGAWALLVMICAVAQLPSLLVLGPVTVYVFTTSSTTAGVVFLIWSLFVGFLDNVLKPLLLGRGSRVPTLVIVIGAIGGMIASGIIGLFVGAVVLAVGYELFVAWVRDREEDEAPPAAATR